MSSAQARCGGTTSRDDVDKSGPMSAFVRKGQETQQQSTVQDLFNSFFRFGEIHNFPVLSVFLFKIYQIFRELIQKWVAIASSHSQGDYTAGCQVWQKLYYSSFFSIRINTEVVGESKWQFCAELQGRPGQQPCKVLLNLLISYVHTL